MGSCDVVAVCASPPVCFMVVFVAGGAVPAPACVLPLLLPLLRLPLPLTPAVSCPPLACVRGGGMVPTLGVYRRPDLSCVARPSFVRRWDFHCGFSLVPPQCLKSDHFHGHRYVPLNFRSWHPLSHYPF